MVAPFLDFNGNCGEAPAFYESVFATKNKTVQTFGAVPGADAHLKDKILHAEMNIEDAPFRFGDTPEAVSGGTMITPAVTYPKAESVRAVFDKLLDGGRVLIPLSPKPYSPLHGCVRDRFGIGRQIICR